MEQSATINQNLEENVQEILRLLRGSPLNPEDKGLVGKINDLAARVEKMERKADRVKYWLLGVFAPAIYGGVEFVVFLSKKFH